MTMAAPWNPVHASFGRTERAGDYPLSPLMENLPQMLDN